MAEAGDLDPKQFRVDVRGLEHLRGPEHKVVFHGINKSGSLAMTNVLFHGYFDARRGNQFYSTYRQLPAERGVLLRLIGHSTGHAFYSAHYLYGSYRHRQGEHLLTTQFRNPLPRIFSCYQWLKSKTPPGESFPPFEQWVVETKGTLHSQVAQFAIGFGAAARDKLMVSHGEDLLEQALTNIDRDVHWFGIAEHFEESIFAMAAICGLPSVRAWQKDNRNKERALVHDWPQEHVELVREVFRWDFLLYDWAVARFHNRMADVELGGDIDRYRAVCQGEYKDRLGADGQPIVAGAGVADVVQGRPSIELVARLRVEKIAAQAVAERARAELAEARAAQQQLAKELERAKRAAASSSSLTRRALRRLRRLGRSS